MTSTELIFTILVFALAGILLLLGIRHFRERGKLLNNAYLFASEKERETMDKRPLYRQSGTVFCLLSLVFVMIGLSIVLHNTKITLLEIPVAAAVLIYSIVSTAKINRQAQQTEENPSHER